MAPELIGVPPRLRTGSPRCDLEGRVPIAELSEDDVEVRGERAREVSGPRGECVDLRIGRIVG